MQRGDSGDDVSKLQELLQKVPNAYPPEVDSSSTISGYYGSLTEAAVKNFQEGEGLKQTGVVDQGTRKKLYELVASLVVDENTPEFDPIDLSTVADLQNLTYLRDQTSRSSDGKVSLVDLQNQISELASSASNTEANITDLQNQISQITSDISELQSGISVLQNLPPPPSPSPSPSPAPLPLLTISSVQATNITRTSSTITWATNNPSTSEVDYSQNYSMPADQTLTVSNTVMATSHSLLLLQLKNDTKYYYRVVSKDATGAVASSTNFSFNTLH